MSEREPTTGQYNPAELFGGMRLTEAEILVATQFAGDPSNFEEDYQSIDAGSTVTLTTEENEDERSEIFKVNLETIIDGITTLEDAHGNPPYKLFEGTIVETTRQRLNPGDGVFGILFPNGFGSLVDSAPDSDYTDLRIRAAFHFLPKPGEEQ